jgi:hypothetical protein
MNRLLAIAALGTLIMLPFASGHAQVQQPQTPPASPLTEGVPGLLPVPQGRATVMGGEIHNVDPVRDQFTLEVPGGRPIKLLFDARTQLYRDGVKIAPGDLHSGDRASVETVLDGTNVFALSIHMLSHPPEGECQGQVLSYDSQRRELTLRDALSRQPIRLLVPPNTQTIPADLVPGTLLSVKFESDNQGRGVARQIAILATPGASFVFSGNISALDLHTGLMALVDAASDKSYQISFSPAQFPSSHDLHLGEHVTVTATFDRTGYVASAIAVD